MEPAIGKPGDWEVLRYCSGVAPVWCPQVALGWPLGSRWAQFAQTSGLGEQSWLSTEAFPGWDCADTAAIQRKITRQCWRLGASLWARRVTTGHDGAHGVTRPTRLQRGITKEIAYRLSPEAAGG